MRCLFLFIGVCRLGNVIRQHYQMSTGYIVTSCDFNIKEGCTFFCPMERNCPKPTAKQFLLLMNNLINLKNAYYHLSHK